MTLRGRLTIAGVLLALGFAAGRWAAPLVGPPRRPDPNRPLPPVAAGPEGVDPTAVPSAVEPLTAGTALFDLVSLGPAEALPSAAAPMPAPPVAPAAPEELLERLPPSARIGSTAALAAELAPGERVVERIEAPSGLEGVLGPLEVEYAIEPELTRAVARILEQGRVELAHVIVLDPVDGRVLAYVSTDPAFFPPTRPYPMASLMKVVTAAAVLRTAPEAASRPCVFLGSPYYLSARLLDPPRAGHSATFERALATSNNQCFAQLAVNQLGAPRVFDELASLGVVEAPGPGHAPGEVDPIETRLDLGELGSGLAGSRLPPLAAARLAAALADGQLVTPNWIKRITDANGVDLALPAAAPRSALDPAVTSALRGMLVETTVSGTARRAFRGRGGRPLLPSVRVAGKTGSLSGRNPDGHYEWFIGVAPAEEPRIAVATLVVNRGKWRLNASQVAAQVLRAVFCDGGACRPERRGDGRRAEGEARRAPTPPPA